MESLQNLDSLLERYSDSLTLVTSENKQWTSVTGFPKSGNPVIIPRLHHSDMYRCQTCTSNSCHASLELEPQGFPRLKQLNVLNKILAAFRRERNCLWNLDYCKLSLDTPFSFT